MPTEGRWWLTSLCWPVKIETTSRDGTDARANLPPGARWFSDVVLQRGEQPSRKQRQPAIVRALSFLMPAVWSTGAGAQQTGGGFDPDCRPRISQIG